MTQSRYYSKPSKIVRACRATAALLLLSPLAGCGLSSLTSGLGTSVFGGDSSNSQAPVQSVTEEQLLSAAKADVSDTGPVGASNLVAYGCPKVRALPRESKLTIYEEGRVGDGLAIKHRGEITKTARECLIERGRVTIKYGFSGRVLLGPKGQPGVISFPVNVALADGARTNVGADKLQVSVNMSLEKPIGYFSAVRTITFDLAEGSRPGEYELSLSFDRTMPGSG